MGMGEAGAFCIGLVSGGLLVWALFRWAIQLGWTLRVPPEVRVEPQIVVQVNGQTIGRITGEAVNVTVHPIIDMAVCATAAEAAGYELLRRPLN